MRFTSTTSANVQANQFGNQTTNCGNDARISSSDEGRHLLAIVTRLGSYMRDVSARILELESVYVGYEPMRPAASPSLSSALNWCFGPIKRARVALVPTT